MWCYSFSQGWKSLYNTVVVHKIMSKARCLHNTTEKLNVKVKTKG